MNTTIMHQKVSQEPFWLMVFLLVLNTSPLNAQKKTMSSDVYDEWYSINQPKISHDGRWIAYELSREQLDGKLCIYDTSKDQSVHFDRAEKVQFSEDNRYLTCFVYPSRDSIRALKRAKVKEKNLPGDTLFIYDLWQNKTLRIPDVKSFELPEKWPGWLVYQMKPETTIDSSGMTTDSLTAKPKKETDRSGSKLILHELATGKEIIYPFVKEYILAEQAPVVLFSSTGNESEFIPGIYLFDAIQKTVKALLRHKGEYSNLAISENGTQAAFIADLDTTKARIRPYQLFYYEEGVGDEAGLIVAPGDHFMPKDWGLSADYKPHFSKDGNTLFFGTAPPPVLPDTTLLEEEKVTLEVWHYEDNRLQTQQNVTLKDDQKKSYRCAWLPKSGRFQQLANPELPEIQTGNEGNSEWVLVYTEEPYLKYMSWEGYPIAKDVYVMNIKTGRKQLVSKGLKASPTLSPAAKYVYWYNYPDSAWYSYNIATNSILTLTDNNTVAYYDEEHDTPSYPDDYGIVGWSENDEFLYIYDRYDIWQVSPNGKYVPKKLTDGRPDKTRYRYIRLDPEQRFFRKDESILLSLFQETDKQSGYAELDLGNSKLKTLIVDDYHFDTNPIKARDANTIVYTKENFNTFPDLYYFTNKIKKSKRVSQVNPQQDNYNWGSIELYHWTDSLGRSHSGMLAKPANFNPTQKYPMIVNFYERSSDGLHRHRAPYPHRSTINYSVYTNLGYLVFNPDIRYTEGTPGENAYQTVMSGVAALLEDGFVDRKRIGLQGHSWGGYQVAYIITKTDLFACAESGAPVVNMFSAYGGIRWQTGLSRMFQYEHTQSRIGATIWEKPELYWQNSPLFFLDKVTTPVLILHNDKDGAVPWYQGIEFFVAMRRLNKAAWLLNYNDEPHWPVKRQNRVDFQTRMLAFFDHYLMGKEMPDWMRDGVKALER